MKVFVDISCDEPGWSEADIVPLVTHALTFEGVPDACEVSVSLITPSEIAELNERYRGVAGPTDVLSFPMDDPDAEGGDVPEIPLGDIMIAPSVARSQAPTFGNTFDQEMSLLLVHGCLHLLGYDHVEDDDAEKMEAEERAILSAWEQRP